MRTKWACDDCGYAGHIEHKLDEGVWGVVQMINDAHRQMSAQCHTENGNRSIRVTIDASFGASAGAPVSERGATP